jgi:hypothetical protein
VTVLDNTDGFEQREKLVELICHIGINTIKDAYSIYSNIRSSLFKPSEDEILKFFIDTSGLLSYNDDESMEEVLL